jgi:HAD superfamily phosphatase (TIGR01681 family)
MDCIKFVVFDLDDTLVCTHKGELIGKVREVLHTLKVNGYLVGLASYNCQANEVLKKHDIECYFDVVVYENWKEKFDMKCGMLQHMIIISNLPSHQILFLDDQERFLETARELGIRTCQVNKNRRLVYDVLKDYKLIAERY